MTAASTPSGMYEISIVRLPLPRHSLIEATPVGHSISPRWAADEAEALAICQELIQAGYGIEVKKPNGVWKQAEVRLRLKTFRA
jgi:hypothetical protein